MRTLGVGEAPVPGTRYRVRVDDCCVEAVFVATLVEIASGDYVAGALVFDNGVRLERWSATDFDEDPEGT